VGCVVAGDTIRVTDACGLVIDTTMMTSTTKTSADTTEVKTAKGVWAKEVAGDDSPIKGAYAITVGDTTNVGGPSVSVIGAVV
jgi:hypothetical protein